MKCYKIIVYVNMMINQLPLRVLCFGVIFASVKCEDYCNINCQEAYHNCTNPEFQLCLNEQSIRNCGNNSLAFNVILGILASIGIIAIVIRCCLFVRLIGGKNKGKTDGEKEAQQQQPLQNNSSGAEV